MADPHFPNKVLQKMAYLCLSEYDVLDVYYHGERKPLKDGGGSMMIKRYPEYGI